MMGTTMNVIAGLGMGYEYAECRNNEIEIKQGENYYLSMLWQFPQNIILGDLVGKIVTCYPKSSLTARLQAIANILLFALLPFQFVTSSIKHEQYEGIALALNAAWNKSLFSLIPLHFPTHLGNRTIKDGMFIAEDCHNKETCRPFRTLWVVLFLTPSLASGLH